MNELYIDSIMHGATINVIQNRVLVCGLFALPVQLPERWIELAQDGVQWRVLVQAVLNLRFLLPNNYLVNHLVRVLTFTRLPKYLIKFLQLVLSPLLV